MDSSISALIQRAADDIKNSNYAIALTGAGFSTESGIRDFRGPDGLWTKHPELEQKAYEDYAAFESNAKTWWQSRVETPDILADELGKASPNPGHIALRDLEELKKLKCVITQNIDNLHQAAGSKTVIDFHGNISRLRCLSCNRRYPTEEFDIRRLYETNQLPPRCVSCGDPIKPDVVYFGEPIPSDVATRSEQEALNCDLMMVCGTSAVVYPFANLPVIASGRHRTSLTSIFEFGLSRSSQPTIIIEINAEPTPLTEGGISDYLIQGKTGEILPRIVSALRKMM